MPALRPRRNRLLEHRDLTLLLPAALLVVVALSTFALFAYRNTVQLLLEEREAEAALVARRLSRELAADRSAETLDLAGRFPAVREVAVFDGRGRLVEGNDPRPGNDLVVGRARFVRGGETHVVEVFQTAPILRSRERGLEILIPLALAVDGLVLVLVVLSLRQFLAPFRGLLERARAAGQEVPGSQDEVAFLVETFEKALEALQRPRELDELETLQGTLARSLESGVLLTDAQGSVLALNDVGAALLVIEPPPPGTRLAEVLRHHPSLLSAIDGAVRGGEGVQRQECTLSTAEGERSVGLSVHPLRRDDGEMRGFLVLFADLTEVHEEQREQQLLTSLSQIGELTAGIAHELRNSLSTQRGYLALLERDPGGEASADYLAEIRRESDHLQRVLEDFLTFARPGSARPRELDLRALLYRAAADPALGEAAVTVEAPGSENDEADVTVRGDAQLLERALRNLLHNAVEAQRQSGATEPIAARLESSARGVEIQICDRGPGLSREAREKLFDPFFSQRPGGVGMGLALTRRIVLLHQGRIVLEDRSGGGTRARLWIPRGRTATKSNDRDLAAARQALRSPRSSD